MFKEVSPLKRSLFFTVFMLLAALLIFTAGFLPYRDLRVIASRCEGECTAVIIESDAVEEEGGLYYGPLVEFFIDSYTRVRSTAVNSVKSKYTYTPGEKVVVRYSRESPDELYIKTDDTAYKRYFGLLIASIAVASVGLIDLLIHIILAFRSPKGETKTFATTPDGMTFEEWQTLQKLRIEAGEAEDKLRDAVNASSEKDTGDDRD